MHCQCNRNVKHTYNKIQQRQSESETSAENFPLNTHNSFWLFPVNEPVANTEKIANFVSHKGAATAKTFTFSELSLPSSPHNGVIPDRRYRMELPFTNYYFTSLWNRFLLLLQPNLPSYNFHDFGGKFTLHKICINGINN